MLVSQISGNFTFFILLVQIFSRYMLITPSDKSNSLWLVILVDTQQQLECRFIKKREKRSDGFEKKSLQERRRQGIDCGDLKHSKGEQTLCVRPGVGQILIVFAQALRTHCCPLPIKAVSGASVTNTCFVLYIMFQCITLFYLLAFPSRIFLSQIETDFFLYTSCWLFG